MIEQTIIQATLASIEMFDGAKNAVQISSQMQYT